MIQKYNYTQLNIDAIHSIIYTALGLFPSYSFNPGSEALLIEFHL